MRTLAVLLALLLAACGGPDFSGSRAPSDLTLDDAATASRGIAIVGIAARGGASLDTMLQLDQVELAWQPLDPNGPPLLLSGDGCSDANQAPPCVRERMSYFVLTAPAGIYALDHLAVKLGRSIRVRSFAGAERQEFVLFAGAIAYLGDFTVDPQANELVAYTRGDVGALGALKRYSSLHGPVTFVQPTPPGAPRSLPLPIGSR